jgi:transcriptional regulator with XRE-family HTH domain
MFASRTIRSCREASGLTLRALAKRAGTSHSTLAAYEAGRKVPNAVTLERIVHAADWELEVQRHRAPSGTDDALRGQELEEVLALAAHFPARHDRVLRAPVFGRR